MARKSHRTVYRSAGVEISTNIEGFKWPSTAEKIEGLLSAGLIDEVEAERLRVKFLPSTPNGDAS